MLQVTAEPVAAFDVAGWSPSAPPATGPPESASRLTIRPDPPFAAPDLAVSTAGTDHEVAAPDLPAHHDVTQSPSSVVIAGVRRVVALVVAPAEASVRSSAATPR